MAWQCLGSGASVSPQYRRSGIAVAPQWHRRGTAVAPQWHRSGTAVASQCQRSGVAAVSQRCRSGFAVAAQSRLSGTAVAPQWCTHALLSMHRSSHATRATKKSFPTRSLDVCRKPLTDLFIAGNGPKSQPARFSTRSPENYHWAAEYFLGRPWKRYKKPNKTI